MTGEGEPLEEYRLGADLAQLLGDIAHGNWSAYWERGALAAILRKHFRPGHPVWEHVRTTPY